MDQQSSPPTKGPLSPEQLRLIHAWWRAANYLSVGQVYLLDNPLLREPLKPEHVKKRLLGHWGTTPGLNFLYTHLNRAIRARDLDAIFIAGPGHGAPGVVANTWLEGTYSEIYPEISHPYRGQHGQPAREMAENQPRDSLASADRLAQLPAHLACLAAGP